MASLHIILTLILLAELINDLPKKMTTALFFKDFELIERIASFYQVIGNGAQYHSIRLRLHANGEKEKMKLIPSSKPSDEKKA